jgi:hypothetical protein
MFPKFLRFFEIKQKRACIIISNSYQVMFKIVLSNYGIHLPIPKCNQYALEIKNTGFCVGYKLPEINYKCFKELIDWCNKIYPPENYDLDIIFILSDDMVITKQLCEYLNGSNNLKFYSDSGVELIEEDIKQKFNIRIQNISKNISENEIEPLL